MNPAILQSAFAQTALPIMFTVPIAVWINNRTIDGVGRRLDDINHRMDDLHSGMNRRMDDLRSDIKSRLDDLQNGVNSRMDDLRSDMNSRSGEVIVRLDRIEKKLNNHEERLVRLEERTSPVARR